jgi:predicted GNAT family N-acyltransferase
MELRLIEHDSTNYEDMLRLRKLHLLAPIGVPEHFIKPETEKEDYLIGAFDAGELIGCCILTPETEDTIRLRQMVVDPRYRGKGIGALIVSFAEKTGIQNGYHYLSMNAQNPVIGFYQKSGYEVEGEEFFEVGIGHHRMKKKIR